MSLHGRRFTLTWHTNRPHRAQNKTARRQRLKVGTNKMKTTTQKFTRSDYMEKRCSHRAYYGQFVSSHVKQLVVDRIGLPRLMASKDEHLNDIPLQLWDSFWVSHTPSMHIKPPLTIGALLREAGEGNSASTGTCILKEAARQVIEEVRT